MFGGDHSQGIGSINGCKTVYPQARVLWVDAHIDCNTPLTTPSSNLHGKPVAYLSGLAPYKKKPVLSLKHLIYFGIRSYEPEEINMVTTKRVPWYESKVCKPERIPDMKREIERYLFPDGKKEPYWISFDIDGLDQREFGSTGTPELGGITVDFMIRFFEAFLPEAVGMDLTEVNFLRATNDDERERDMRTIRKLIEKIVKTVHNHEAKSRFSSRHQSYTFE